LFIIIIYLDNSNMPMTSVILEELFKLLSKQVGLKSC